ncbi:copper homeostasis protein [Scopulibacillus daqui]|uniref:PF03932 family protein CutC n=1 Tax=Scopulibacillus daqui TaxID=1469162 RepID=A0ABS2Q406_9BACL|nr:copper homeostasis protein CutC [Scopulibacillus daqui]MBM7646560.1 copper homeostasis protein [Scopulibacillus daqui]
MIIEVIATNLQDAVDAERYGADRIELVSAISEDGLTPSFGLIKQVVDKVNIPVQVMIRPHSHSFSYTADDMAVMLQDIDIVKEIGAAGIVVGALDDSGGIADEQLHLLLERAGNLSVTFHRAFDHVADQEKALEQLTAFSQIDRILTSGKAQTADKGSKQIKKLVDQTRDSHIKILAGSGLKPKGLKDFILSTGVQEIHLGSGVRKDKSYLKGIDPDRLSLVKEICSALSI